MPKNLFNPPHLWMKCAKCGEGLKYTVTENEDGDKTANVEPHVCASSEGHAKP